MLRHFYIKFILIALITVVFLSYRHFSNKPPVNIAQESPSISDKRKYWEDRIDQISAEKTYQEFKIKSANDNVSGHANVHLFGEVLYDKLGISAVTICDEFKGQGCFHGLFEKAIFKNGLSEISLFNFFAQECSKRYEVGSGCHHGIGHMVAYYKKYDINNALEFCKTLPGFSTANSGCVGGVFMEYNLRSMRGWEASIPVRPWDPKNPYDPCFEIEKQFQSACLNSISDVWIDQYSDYSITSDLCQKLDNDLTVSCLKGMGRSISERAQFDVEKTISACDSMLDKKSSDICKIGASWSFYFNPPFKNLAQSVCAVSEDHKNDCASEESYKRL